ncbi:MAG TPA: DUF2066 domain-containing protein [Acidisphaera sp.]|nr:DUF2066 domain-containing protein [Acidisphaera sp.]
MPRATIWTIAALLFAAPALAYDPGSDLFQAKTIVTGTDARSRPDGFRQTLLDVLVKASGDPAIASAPGIDAVENDAGTLVQDYRYEDRMWDTPLHDQQGTEDRPYDFTVRFDPQGIEAALARTGHRLWSGDRPPLLLHVIVARGGNKYAVTADGNAADTARQAASLAANRYAMRVVLPPVPPGDRPEDRLRFAPVRVPGAVTLDGTLDWSDRDSGYDGSWTLVADGKPHQWGIRGVSLDEAFRNAVAGAMKILSGNGEPG